MSDKTTEKKNELVHALKALIIEFPVNEKHHTRTMTRVDDIRLEIFFIPSLGEDFVCAEHTKKKLLCGPLVIKSDLDDEFLEIIVEKFLKAFENYEKEPRN